MLLLLRPTACRFLPRKSWLLRFWIDGSLLPSLLRCPQLLEANKSVQAGLSEALENVQQRLLYNWLRMKRVRGEL